MKPKKGGFSKKVVGTCLEVPTFEQANLSLEAPLRLFEIALTDLLEAERPNGHKLQVARCFFAT